MCGICGAVARDPARPADLAAVRRMSRALAHRGPDGDGLVADGPAALASRRLAIVDRSPAGAQPMRLPEAPVWIVHNGEIYNHAEERRRLAGRGHAFVSRSDTEVLLRLYLDQGADCLDRLDGMYAFAVWDGRSRELFAARDPLGKKPFHYRESPDQFAFASEIKALLAAGGTPAVDPAAIHHFLSFDYVPGADSAFRGLHKLPPGHWLRYRGGELRLGRYFRPHLARRSPVPSPAEAAAEIRRRLAAAVDKRRADEVPMGVFLSGGIDSSAITALLAAASGAPIRTFSVAFDEPNHDERHWAARVARRFGTEHREFVVTPALADELPRVVAQFDEPFGDPSALPTYFLAREARREITVALTGEGGDELFAGYDRYRLDALARRWLALPAPVRRAAAAALRPIERGPFSPEHSLRRAARLAAFRPQSAGERYGRWLLHFDAREKQRLYSPEFAAAAPESSEHLLDTQLAAGDGDDPLARVLAADTLGYLAGDLLVKADVASMAHGLEVRCPFLDRQLVDYVSGLPSEYKLRGATRKWILRRALAELLPAAVLHRPKRGFGLPLAGWLRGPLRPLVREVLLSPRAAARGYFRVGELRRLVDEHERGVRPAPFELWNLLVLELWHRERIDVPVAGGDDAPAHGNDPERREHVAR